MESEAKLGTNTTGEEAHARMVEISEGIRRAKEMNIVELIPYLEAERDKIKKEFMRIV